MQAAYLLLVDLVALFFRVKSPGQRTHYLLSAMCLINVANVMKRSPMLVCAQHNTSNSQKCTLNCLAVYIPTMGRPELVQNIESLPCNNRRALQQTIEPEAVAYFSSCL
jgi:hypothetical protein